MEIEAIQKLIEFDKETRSKVEAVHQKKFQLKQEIEEEKKKLSDQAWAETNAKVDQKKKQLDQQIADNQSNTQKSYEENSQRLNDMFQSKKAQWVEMLTNRVIGNDQDG